jgi:putative radical SAM enzyme (TIGR03279 family)
MTVEPESVASQAGLHRGDRLLAINAQSLRDVIDVRVCASEPELAFLIERDGQRMTVTAQRHYGQSLGLDFQASLFDGPMRVCRNHCEFCFVDQMPSDLRASLYVKDDDYRCSFLHGNYITLTNLTGADWDRIADQHLSPLYVSVHATHPETRIALMKNPRAGDIMAQLQRLVAMGIQIHTQVVLVPGRNDGPQLDRTMSDLAALYPNVLTLTVVPVGLTRWRNPDLRPYTDREIAAVLTQVLTWQAQFRATLGVGFVYPADEMYLRAGEPVPEVEAYDGRLDAMVENGVGMVRRFVDTWGTLKARLADLAVARQVWVTGTLFAPVLRAHARVFEAETGVRIDVVDVPNRTFGETVTVAGLLTVEDILAALQDAALRDALDSASGLIVPAEVFRGPGGVALDDQPASVIREVTGCRVYVAALDAQGWDLRAVG